MSKTFDQGQNEVAKLCQYFATNQREFSAPGIKEAHVRQALIDPFFEALGWDVRNTAMAAPQYREVVPEDSLDVEGHQKAPDYAFRVGTMPKFYAEAKKCGVNLNSDPAPAYQLRRYGWSAKIALSVLTDFEELSVYDCTARPRPSDKASRSRIQYLRCEEYPDRWRELWDVFSREAVWSGAFDQYAAAKRVRGTSEVDIEFLKEIEGWREALARNVALRNKGLSPDDLNAAVQRTIDRVVFLRMAEDRGLEPYEQLLRLCEQPKIYARFMRDLCRKADDKYNSGLFHFHKEAGVSDAPDQISPKLIVDDKVLKPILQGLYFAHGSPYHFGVLPVAILGTVYERFLGKVIRLTAGHQAKIEDKPEVRKAGGVYYTPSYIVDYIVKATVGSHIGNRSPVELAGGRRNHPFRVLDMACGSGSFLLGAYQYLLDHCLRWYIDHKPATHKKAVYQDPKSTEWRLTNQERKRILTTHIFGVDLDPQAVEVSKLSLLLKALEGENDATLSMQMKLFHARALPNLADNIKCGNSLIESDFYNTQEPLLFARGTKGGISVFDWHQAFPLAMEAGGFDAVIGNPPYVYRNATEGELKEYFLSHYRCAEGNFELYKFFLEKASRLCQPEHGRVGMIVSATFMVQPSFARLRRLLLQDCTLIALAPLGPGVFIGATVDTAIVVFSYGGAAKSHSVDVVAPPKPENVTSTPAYRIQQSRFSANPGQVIDYRLTDDGARLVERLWSDFPALDTCFQLGVGINTGFIRAELVAESKLDDRYHPMVPGTGISRYGEVRTSGWIMYDREYVRSRGSKGRTLPDERFFRESKILVVRTRNLSLPVRVIAALDRTGAYNLNRLSNIVSRGSASLVGLLGILNSALYNWLFTTRFFDYEIKPVYLKVCPIADTTDGKLVGLVEARVQAESKLQSVGQGGRSGSVRNHIAALEAAIDSRVFDLYGLDERERKIAKGLL